MIVWEQKSNFFKIKTGEAYYGKKFMNTALFLAVTVPRQP